MADITGYPGWVWEQCGCCHGTGLVLNGSIAPSDISPTECDACWGNGRIAKHTATGTLALYPGGPLLGKEHDRQEESADG